MTSGLPRSPDNDGLTLLAAGFQFDTPAEEIEQNWKFVQEADHDDIESFVKHEVFELKARQPSMNEIDATWVKRWTWCTVTGRRIVKSRLCGRGFLDRQRL